MLGRERERPCWCGARGGGGDPELAVVSLRRVGGGETSAAGAAGGCRARAAALVTAAARQGEVDAQSDGSLQVMGPIVGADQLFPQLRLMVVSSVALLR